MGGGFCRPEDFARAKPNHSCGLPPSRVQGYQTAGWSTHHRLLGFSDAAQHSVALWHQAHKSGARLKACTVAPNPFGIESPDPAFRCIVAASPRKRRKIERLQCGTETPKAEQD